MRKSLLDRANGVQCIAAAVKLTFQQVEKYERGTNRISGSRMVQFCQLLNVTPNDFFRGVQGINQKTGGTLDSSFLATKALRSRRRSLESKAATTVASSSS